MKFMLKTVRKVGPIPDVPDLGGMFYDFIRDRHGSLVGVRYWLDTDCSQEDHPIFSHFEGDPRVQWSGLGYVDLLFRGSSVPDHAAGRLVIEAAQDFGGDHVDIDGSEIVITFELEIGSCK